LSETTAGAQLSMGRIFSFGDGKAAIFMPVASLIYQVNIGKPEVYLSFK
jgi:hypothetical protein